MSQRQQIRLAFSNSPRKMTASALASVKCKPLRAICSVSPLAVLCEQLEREQPEAAALIKQLILDALTDRPLPYPLE